MNKYQKEKEAFGRLLEVMDDLREKCPWDSKQTMDSLRSLTIEEVYELHVDGSFNEEKARLGQIFGDVIRRDIPKFICELANDLEKANKSFAEYINSNENEFKALVKKYNC
jgi:NTP pyrophosphatase (non-canonical NTP hydrolase)